MKITDIKAREILDSRGNPTIEVDIVIENNCYGRYSVPSGASVGSREALELRDNDKNRFFGKGVITAVANVNGIIRENILNMNFDTQKELDDKLIALDGTENKSRLGANSVLGVSGAFFKASAVYNQKNLYDMLGDRKIPLLMVNILNGGKHSNNNISFQEFMIIPRRNSVRDNVRIASEVFHSLKTLLNKEGYSTAVGDEGGFAPNLKSNEAALDFIVEAIKMANYVPGVDVFLALDVAATSIYDKGNYLIDGNKYSSDELLNYYSKLLDKYPIVSIEDPVYENDFELFAKATKMFGDRVILVGDDLFVTNPIYLQKGIDMEAGNAILIKPNQIGTISEMITTIKLAKENNYKTIMSHRSGETEDTLIASLAVGVGTDFIKTGSMSRGERICKYNELMRIEEEIDK